MRSVFAARLVPAVAPQTEYGPNRTSKRKGQQRTPLPRALPFSLLAYIERVSRELTGRLLGAGDCV